MKWRGENSQEVKIQKLSTLVVKNKISKPNLSAIKRANQPNVGGYLT